MKFSHLLNVNSGTLCITNASSSCEWKYQIQINLIFVVKSGQIIVEIIFSSVTSLELIFSSWLLIKIDQHEIIFKTSPKTCRLLKKMSFQPMNFRHLELNGGYFGFLRRVHGTFFLGIVHIFLDVSAKFQHYNIFFPGSSTKLVPTTALFTRNFLILFSVLVSISIDNEMSIQKFMVKFSFLHNFSSRNSHV